MLFSSDLCLLHLKKYLCLNCLNCKIGASLGDTNQGGNQLYAKVNTKLYDIFLLLWNQMCLFTCRGIINSRLYAYLKKPLVSQNMARPSSGNLYSLNFWFLSIFLYIHFVLCVCVWFCSDLAAFRNIFSNAKKIVIITGAGVSAESGVPTFRGAGGYWRKWNAQVCSHII